MNSTANGSIKSWSCFDQFVNSTAFKIGGTVTYCLFIIVSLAANSLIVMIVYKTPNLRKPINYFIANMASSDLLYPIFVLPWNLSSLHTNSFPIGGKLGQASCKLLPFLRNVSIVVSTQNLILIAVDRFGVILYPIIVIKLKTQEHPGEQSANSATAGQKKQKRASNVHCYRNSVCALLVTLLYQLFNRMVSGQFHAFLV